MASQTFKKFQARYHYSYILLQQLVKSDFKLRYQGSVLGYLWSLLRPLAIFLIMYIVFLKFLRFNYGVPHSTVYLLLGIVLWNFFTEVTSTGLSSIVGKGDLLRKINFPKYVVVLAVSFSALINLILNFVVIAVFMVADHVSITPHILWALPLLAELFVIALAFAFMLSAVFVKLRDMSYIWEVLLQGAFYATPIFYPLILVPAKYAKFMMLNPIAQIIQDLRHVIVTPKTPTITTYWHSGYIRLVPISIVVAIAVVSVYYFRKNSKNFAEDI
ncbi:MAG TPA: ABC transporter permease [Patescibacteria group bacterium]|nr:ABC transporter permease [Patescibacteria group bacterium]